MAPCCLQDEVPSFVQPTGPVQPDPVPFLPLAPHLSLPGLLTDPPQVTLPCLRTLSWLFPLSRKSLLAHTSPSFR